MEEASQISVSIVKVLFQERWATLIFIFRQECTQFPIVDAVIVHSTKENLKNIFQWTAIEYFPNILGLHSYARETKQLLSLDIVLHDSQMKGVIFYPALKFFEPGTVFFE